MSRTLLHTPVVRLLLSVGLLYLLVCAMLFGGINPPNALSTLSHSLGYHTDEDHTRPPPPPSLSELVSPGRVTVDQKEIHVTLTNKYMRVTVNTLHPHVQALEGRFQAAGELSHWYDAAGHLDKRGERGRGGYVLETEEGDAGQPLFIRSCADFQQDLKVQVNEQNADGSASVTLTGIHNAPGKPLVEETWTISLGPSDRFYRHKVDGRVLRAGQVRMLRHSLYVRPMSVYALFDQLGVVQMQEAYDDKEVYANDDNMSRLYALGGGGSAEVVYENTQWPNNQKGFHLVRNRRSNGKNDLWRSAYHKVFRGSHTPHPHWTDLSILFDAKAKPVPVQAGETYSSTFTVAVNNDNFPTHQLSPVLNLPVVDTRVLLTGAYATSAGTFNVYDVDAGVATPGTQCPSIHHPECGYTGTYNYFDPDSLFSITALLYTGDVYMQKQSVRVLQTSLNQMLPDGQLPHHFNNVEPVYKALSQTRMPGPNVFWLWSAINMAESSTVGHTWLLEEKDRILKVWGWLMKHYSEKEGLFVSPGPLMVDTFKRAGLTTDFNAAMVYMLDRMRQVLQLYGENADKLQTIRRTVIENMNSRLWAKDDDDHYITHIDSDTGDRLDMVDYDSNLLAVAFGIAPDDRARRILRRVDEHARSNGRKPGYVSERFYDKEYCHLGNTGDSDKSLGRIFYVDALSRRRLDLPRDYQKLQRPIVHDLIRNTWLRERYDSRGRPAAHEAFFEWPAVLVTLLREAKYGIRIGLQDVRIDPWATSSSWTWAFGDVVVSFSPYHTAVQLPLTGARRVSIHSLFRNREYSVVGCDGKQSSQTASPSGVIVFHTEFTPACVVQISLALAAR